MEIKNVLRGNVPSNKLTFLLPGAFLDNKWVGVLDIPGVQVGDELVVFGAATNGTDIRMLNGPDSVFRMVSTGSVPVAADFDGNPLINIGCTTSQRIARPTDQAPPSEGNDLPEGAPERVFVSEPASLGLPWDMFLSILATCIDTQPASTGSTAAIGGGW